MTQSEIQKYSEKCAELICDEKINLGNNDCYLFPAALNKNRSCYLVDNMKFHTSYDWQIKVWQKVYHQFRVNVVKKLIREPKYFLELREQYFKTLDTGAPLDSFAILCKCVDLIEKGEGK
jgi:hypothetical protein